MMAEIEQQLRERVPALRLVGGAASLASLFAGTPQRPPQMPAAYVFLARERAAPGHLIGAVDQDVTASIGVTVVAGAAGDVTGDAGAQALEPLLAEVRTALVGWRVPETDRPTEYEGGQVVAFAAGAVWFQQTYRTGYRVRAV